MVKQQCRVITDATLIAADASLDSLIHNDPEQAQKEAVSQQSRRGLIDPSASRRVTNKTHRSRTDPDATLAEKRGAAQQLKYKVHQSIDADSRVILDTEVTTGARHDNQPYLDQLQRIRDQYKITIREAIADRGYGSAAIIRALQTQGVETYLPLWSGRVGNSKYRTSGLIYEKEHDRIRCPQGKYLTPNPAIWDNHQRYASSAEDCRVCPQATTCPARTRPTSHQRFVVRSLDQDLFEQVQSKMEEPPFAAKLSERMWKIEGLFAEAKRNHCLSRAKYCGRAKVQIQAYLCAIAQNLKRLLFLLYQGLVTWWSRKAVWSTPSTSNLDRKPDFFNTPVRLIGIERCSHFVEFPLEIKSEIAISKFITIKKS